MSGTCGVLAVAGVVALMKWSDRRDARHAAQGSLWIAREAIVSARPVSWPQALQAPAPPAIVNHYGPQFHIYGRDGEEAAARMIRQALTGPAGTPSPKNDH